MPAQIIDSPFTRTPKFNRSSFLQSPDWRWQQARLYNNAQLMHISRPQPSDVKVAYAVRIQKAIKDPVRRQFIELKMPDVWQVCTLGTGSLNAPMRCQLQACLIGGLDQQQTANKLHWVSQIQVCLYRDLFFDLTGIQGISGWFQQMLLSPIKSENANNMFRARAIAHYHSVDVALKSLRFGNTGSEAKKVMAAMWKDERNKKVFDYMARNLNVPVQVYSSLMQQAIKSIQDRDFAIQMKGQQQQDSITLQIAQAIQKGIRGYTQDEIKKASQQQSGNDIANMYIKNILQEPKVQINEQPKED